MLLYQNAVNQGWRVYKADVKAAFLQGQELKESKYARATDELCGALGVPPGEIIGIQKAVYGLGSVTREWYNGVDTVIQELGGGENQPSVHVHGTFLQRMASS